VSHPRGNAAGPAPHAVGRGTEPKTTRWGLPLQDWETAKAQAGEALVERARGRGTLTYSELCEAVTVARFRPYSWRLVALLDEICAEEDAEHGIILATLVVRRDSGLPGDGYFAALERLGRDVTDRLALWNEEAERVWSAYSRV
jgi:hypothetical protein